MSPCDSGLVNLSCFIQPVANLQHLPRQVFAVRQLAAVAAPGLSDLIRDDERLAAALRRAGRACMKM
jgi:hypothetical protein